MKGNRDAGITTCLEGDELLIFMGARGRDSGYSKHDGELLDGRVSYTGQGQVGHQDRDKGANAQVVKFSRASSDTRRPVHHNNSTTNRSRWEPHAADTCA